MKQVFLLLLFCLSLSSCDKDKNEDESSEIILWVNHYKEDCQNLFAEQQCLLVQEGQTLTPDSWKIQFEGIANFDYESGFIYKLRVQKIRLTDPPQDASNISFTLLETLTKEKYED